jgi:tRNA (cytosine34-C5)-methyltransferase
MNAPGLMYEAFDSIPESKNQKARDLKSGRPSTTSFSRRGLVRSMFPPKQAEDAALLAGMSNCMRIYPQLQNTGGFFVALLQKVADVSFEKPAASSNDDKKPETNVVVHVTADSSQSAQEEDSSCAEQQEHANKKPCIENAGANSSNNSNSTSVPSDYIDRCTRVERIKHRLSKVLPYIPMTESDVGMAKFRTIQEFYGLAPDFPHAQLLAHSERMKTITYVTQPVRLVLDACRHDGQLLNVVSAGLRMFDEKSAEHMTCVYRLCLEGLQILLPYMTKRVVTIPYDTMLQFLEKAEMPTENLNLAEQALSDLTSGSFALQTHPGDADRHHVAVVAWKGKTSVKLWSDQEEASSILEKMQSCV